MTGKVIRELEAWRLSDGDNERRERIEAIRSYLKNPDPAEAADPDREAMAKAAAFLETDEAEAERIIRAHFGPPEPKRLAPLPFGAPVPAPVLWRATADDGLADAVLSVGEVAILSGEGSAGKSTVTLSLARAAATAPDGFGEACGLRVRPGPVVLVSYEDSGVRIAHRLARMRGPDPDPARIPHWPDPGPLYHGFDGGNGQGPGADWPALWAAVRELAPSLVVIDPASSALADASMNEGGPVRAFMGALAREADAAGCGVLVVAHSTKADRATDEPGPGAVAGSATWFDAARGLLYLTWKAAKHDDRDTERRRELRCIKANHGRSGWSVTLNERGQGGEGFTVAPGNTSTRADPWGDPP